MPRSAFAHLRASAAAVLLVCAASPQTVFQVTSALVTVRVVAVDAGTHRAVRGLKAADFRLAIDGTKVPVSFLDESSVSPAAVGVVVDWRTITHGRQVGALLRRAPWVRLVQSLPKPTMIGFYQTFSGPVDIRSGGSAPGIIPFTAIPGDVERAAQGITPNWSAAHGSTDSGDPLPLATLNYSVVRAVTLASSQLAQLDKKYQKDLIVVGADVNAAPSQYLAPVLAALCRAHVRVSTIQMAGFANWLARHYHGPHGPPRGKNYLRELSAFLTAQTGGVLTASSAGEVPSKLFDLLADLRYSYVLSFRPPAPTAATLEHHLTVTYAHRAGEPKLHLFYPAQVEFPGPNSCGSSGGGRRRDKRQP